MALLSATRARAPAGGMLLPLLAVLLAAVCVQDRALVRAQGEAQAPGEAPRAPGEAQAPGEAGQVPTAAYKPCAGKAAGAACTVCGTPGTGEAGQQQGPGEAGQQQGEAGGCTESAVAKVCSGSGKWAKCIAKKTPATPAPACENAKVAMCSVFTADHCTNAAIGHVVKEQCGKLCNSCGFVAPAATTTTTATATPTTTAATTTVPPTTAPATAAPAPVPAKKGFDFGGKCEGGEGAFSQDIKKGVTVPVPGVIPAGKMSVRVELTSAKDVDVQLIDIATGTEIVAWPRGLLNKATKQSTTYEGVVYTYSGYNGDGTGKGNEYITVTGTTNRDLRMRAYGYAAGSAAIKYSWEAPPGCVDQGQGEFTASIPYRASSVVGKIPAGKRAVSIRLSSPKDVDVQLFDTDNGKPIVAWGVTGTLIQTAGEKCVEYTGSKSTVAATYCYSGYNGVAGKRGNEWISITGESGSVTMKAYGYAAGSAQVEYSWGQDGYCAGSSACRLLSKTLPYNTAITGALCKQAAADCTWVTTKPYK